VFIGNDRTSYQLVAFMPEEIGLMVTLLTCPIRTGRWLMITRHPPYQMLTLCEVMVMGYRPTGIYRFSLQ